MDAELLRLHLAASDAFTGNTVGPAMVTMFSGEMIASLVAAFFFIVVWWGAPIIEWFVKQLYKAVDKLYDFWH